MPLILVFLTPIVAVHAPLFDILNAKNCLMILDIGYWTLALKHQHLAFKRQSWAFMKLTPGSRNALVHFCKLSTRCVAYFDQRMSALHAQFGSGVAYEKGNFCLAFIYLESWVLHPLDHQFQLCRLLTQLWKGGGGCLHYASVKFLGKIVFLRYRGGSNLSQISVT